MLTCVSWSLWRFIHKFMFGKHLKKGPALHWGLISMEKNIINSESNPLPTLYFPSYPSLIGTHCKWRCDCSTGRHAPASFSQACQWQHMLPKLAGSLSTGLHLQPTLKSVVQCSQPVTATVKANTCLPTYAERKTPVPVSAAIISLLPVPHIQTRLLRIQFIWQKPAAKT